MSQAYAMAGVTPADVNVAEVHDCFTVMGAIGTEVIGKAPLGEGARYWVDGKAAPARRVRHQHLGRADREGPPDRRHRRRDDRLGGVAAAGQGADGAAGAETPRAARDVQHRRPDLRLGLHGADARGLRPRAAGPSGRSEGPSREALMRRVVPALPSARRGGLALLALGIVVTAVSARLPPAAGPAPDEARLRAMTARFAPVDIGADVSSLPRGRAPRAREDGRGGARRRRALPAPGRGPATRRSSSSCSTTPRPLGRERRSAFLLDKGPWSRLDHDAPFVPGVPAEARGRPTSTRRGPRRPRSRRG